MKSRVAIFALILLIGYSLLLGYWMLWGFGRTTQPDYSYNLVPFLTITSYFPITSFGPIISLQLMNNASYLITFLLLACILSIGLLAACLIRHEAGELNNQ